MNIENTMDRYDEENLPDELEASESSDDMSNDHVSTAIVHEGDHSIIRNSYYSIESQTESMTSVRMPNSVMNMDEIEKIKIVKNVYYEY